MFGAYIGGSLAGFIGQHAEDSNIAFCQIEQENTDSIELQKSLGMEISDKQIYWLF